MDGGVIVGSDLIGKRCRSDGSKMRVSHRTAE
jgi:hypothetical protein